LEISRRNYLKWTQDVIIHLTAKKMRSIINVDNVAREAFKASAIIFIKKHMEKALQAEYPIKMMHRLSGSLWKSALTIK
jgi:tRNA(Phe) wybutosine-synthesizing methylase Tyw3